MEDYKCPICGTQLSLDDSLQVSIDVDAPKDPVKGQPALSLKAAKCSNCGFVALFNVKRTVK